MNRTVIATTAFCSRLQVDGTGKSMQVNARSGFGGGQTGMSYDNHEANVMTPCQSERDPKYGNVNFRNLGIRFGSI